MGRSPPPLPPHPRFLSSMPNLDNTAFVSVFDNPEFTRWFFGQSVAFIAIAVCLGLWIRTLLKDNRGLLDRTEKLSEDLVQHVEHAMRERLQMADDSLLRHDSTVRNIVTSFSDALSKRRRDLEG